MTFQCPLAPLNRRGGRGQEIAAVISSAILR